MSGQIKGMTVLPQPDLPEMSEDGSLPHDPKVVRAVLHRIETFVISWAHQLRDVLLEDSDQLLAENGATVPSAEIDFWLRRSINLGNLHEQMIHPRMIQMRNLLEQQQSSYFNTIAGLYNDITAALWQARDLNRVYQASQAAFEDFEQREFADIAEGFRALLHVIRIMWKNSENFGEARRVIIVLTEMSNQLLILVCSGSV